MSRQKTRAELLAAGRAPLLTARDFDPTVAMRVGTASGALQLTGPIRPTNTRYGPRLFVEVRLVGTLNVLREWAVSFRSHNYVRLCELFGEDCTRWKDQIVDVHIVKAGDGKARVEIFS